MSDIFISYTKDDHATARMLAGALEKTGWKVFWDHEVPPGMTWRDYIGRELDQTRCMIVVWSKSSVDSDWVLEEAEIGRQRRILIPVRIGDVMPPLGFQSIQAANLSEWDGSPDVAAFKILLSAIEAKLGPAPHVEKEHVKKDIGPIHKKEEETPRRPEAEEKKEYAPRVRPVIEKEYVETDTERVQKLQQDPEKPRKTEEKREFGKLVARWNLLPAKSKIVGISCVAIVAIIVAVALMYSPTTPDSDEKPTIETPPVEDLGETEKPERAEPVKKAGTAEEVTVQDVAQAKKIADSGRESARSADAVTWAEKPWRAGEEQYNRAVRHEDKEERALALEAYKNAIEKYEEAEDKTKLILATKASAEKAEADMKQARAGASELRAEANASALWGAAEKEKQKGERFFIAKDYVSAKESFETARGSYTKAINHIKTKLEMAKQKEEQEKPPIRLVGLTKIKGMAFAQIEILEPYARFRVMEGEEFGDFKVSTIDFDMKTVVVTYKKTGSQQLLKPEQTTENFLPAEMAARYCEFASEKYTRNDFAGAFEWWWKAKEVDPDNAAARGGLAALEKRAIKKYREGYMFAGKGSVEAAAKCFNEVMQILPSNHEYYIKAQEKMVQIGR